MAFALCNLFDNNFFCNVFIEAKPFRHLPITKSTFPVDIFIPATLIPDDNVIISFHGTVAYRDYDSDKCEMML